MIPIVSRRISGARLPARFGCALVLLPLLLWIAASFAHNTGRRAAAASLTILVLMWVPLPGELFVLRQQAVLLFALTILLVVLARRASQQAKKGGMNGRLSMPGGQ